MFIPKQNSHKGENGKILVIAGSKRYHGSAILAIKAAIPFVDIVYYYPPQLDPFLINAVKNIPEVIVIYDYKEILSDVDAILIGPGIANIKIPLERFRNKKRVIDGDGLKQISRNVVDKKAVLTPHAKEFERTFIAKPTKENVMEMARYYNTNILLKGFIDYLSDGKRVVENIMGNAGLTKGGTGDALAGFTTAIIAKNDVFEGTFFAVEVFCKVGDELFNEKGYYYTPSEVINRLPYMVKKEMEMRKNEH